jgi:peptidoglycan-associated lipoprotein
MRTHPDRRPVQPTSAPVASAGGLLLSLALALSLPGLVACSKSKRPTTPVASTPAPVKPRPPAARPPAAPQTATVTAQPAGDEPAPSFAPIRFELDSAVLSTEARDELQRVGDWMAGNRARLTIEGHADERGATEYNLALGQQRAAAIAQFLTRLGIAGARLETISYGEERPAVDGSDEAAWAANRRGQLEPGR